MTPIKLRAEETINNFDVDYDFTNKVAQNIQRDLSNKFESIITEGLRHKGYNLETKTELVGFIEEFCRYEYDSDRGEKTYFIDNVPFLLHKYKPVIDARPQVTGNTVTIGASTSYVFL